MEYKIVSTSGFGHNRVVAKLTAAVNDAILQGWEPIGGVAVVGTRLCQTLVKRRK